MRPTRRGLAFVLFGLLSVALLVTTGQPGLGVVAVGSFVVLVASAGQVLWARPPTVERRGPDPGHAGESRSVELRLDTPHPYLAIVREQGSAGVAGFEAATTVGGDPLTYDLAYEERGAHRLGPVEVEARDTLGLFSRRFTAGPERTVLVYPRVRALTGGRTGAPALVAAAGVGAEREFDHLREYRPGDSPRDVDWRATAKRDELIVAEYEERGETAVVIAAGGPSRYADTLAEAVASVALQLLDSGTAVGLALPDERVPPSADSQQREQLLEALARTEAGPRPDAEASVEVTVLTGGRVKIESSRSAATLDWPPDGDRGDHT